MVDFAKDIPILLSSSLIRGDPQKGFAFDISRIRQTIYGSVAGRPDFPFLHSFVQCSLKFLRLQAMIVAGLTKYKASFQPGHNFEIRGHNIRSVGLILGLLSFR